MEFYGREEEQKQINYILSKNDFASDIIYGRRRLGKMDLITYVCPINDKTNKRKNGQFDLVTKSKEGYTVFEVKFTNSKIDNHIVNEEISQTNLKPINYGFISKTGFNITNNNNYILITLDDIYY